MVSLRSIVCSLALIAACLSCGGGDRPTPTVPGAPSSPGVPAPAPGPGLGPVGTGAHAYFEALSSRADVVGAYSLRDQGMIETYVRNRPNRSVTYDYAADTYPAKQDAAKIVIPADRVSLPNQIWLPVNRTAPVLITWDAWFGREFAHSNHGITRYKNFHICSPEDTLWYEVRSDFKRANLPAIAMVDTRGNFKGLKGPNVTNTDPIEPQANQFTIFPETWVRYWALVDVRQTDRAAPEWSLVSLWVADENTDAVQILEQRQIKVDRHVGIFRLEYNTSTEFSRTPARGPMVAYARNVVMLGDIRYQDVPALFQRPRK